MVTFGLDPRTVDDWWARSSQHGQAGYQARVLQGQMDLQQVQMYEIYHKVQGGVIWLAMAVSTRLWSGAVGGNTSRDKALMMALALLVKAAALRLSL